jgi:two-component system chemotaxis response regulator CheB
MATGKFIIVIGASAGGTVILPDLLEQLTDKMDISVFLVIHLSKRSIGDLLVSRLQKCTPLTCKIPDHDERIERKHVYIAPPDHHLIVKKNKILVGNGPMENRYRPSIDALFRSAAVAFGPRVLGIILSGMLEDGTSGMLAIKKAGGLCMIQEPDEAKYPDMPKAVLSALKPDYILPVPKMGEAIREIMRTRKPSGDFQVPKEVLREAEIAERVHVGIDQVQDLGANSSYSCPDCGGGLWEIKENGVRRYRCHVGHAFTEDGLLSSMENSTETALWTALRIIEERKNLLRRIADKEKNEGGKNTVAAHNKRAEELELQIRNLKRVLFSMVSD